MIHATAAFLLFYLEVSLIVAVGILVLRSVRWFDDRQVLRLDCGARSRLARTIFLAMLLAPPAAHATLWATQGLVALSGAFPEGHTRTDASASGVLAASGGWDVAPLAQVTADQADRGVAIVASLLIGGMIWACFQTAGRIVRLRRLVRGAERLRSVGRIRVVVTDRISTPFSTAIWGPAYVVLPISLLRHPADLRIVLRHELQHYRNRDPRWTIGLELFRLLFYWHPAAHLWVRELTALQELACDEAIVRRGTSIRAYGGCLIRVASMAVEERVIASTAMATASERGAGLTRRIDMLFDHPVRGESLRSRRLVGVVGVALVALVAQGAAVSWPTASDLPSAGQPTATAGFDQGVVSTVCVDQDCGTTTPVNMDRVPDLEFEYADGTTVQLVHLEGKVVLVDFWASWCRFCLDELPFLKTLDRELGGADFEIVGVSLSRGRDEFETFVAEHDVPWAQLHVDEGWGSEVARTFGIKALPGHVLIDRQGRFTRIPLGDPDVLAEAVLARISER